MQNELVRARELAAVLEPGTTLLDTELSREVAKLLLALAFLVEAQQRYLQAAGLAIETPPPEPASNGTPGPLTPEVVPEDIPRPARIPLLPPD